MRDTVLEVKNLTVDYGGPRVAVDDVSLRVRAGEVTGLIGESGSGKSTLAYAVVNYLPGATISGVVSLNGDDVLSLSTRSLRSLRGGRVGFVHQDPRNSLNPAMKIGVQVEEQLKLHTGLDAAARKARVIELLTDVDLPSPTTIIDRYPHQLSGGQQQRVGIAMALSCEPELLIMDEPTTGLDVTTAKRIIELIRRIRSQREVSILYISHDLSLVASLADQVVVLRRGKLIESGATEKVLGNPSQDYTQHLVNEVRRVESTPRSTTVLRDDDDPSVTVSHLVKEYRSQRGKTLRAVNDVSLTAHRGRTLAIVGESGSGKTTLARCIAGLLPYDSGTVEVVSAEQRPSKAARAQMVFQNPHSSLNPKHRVGSALVRALRMAKSGSLSRAVLRERAAELLAQVELSPDYLSRFPAQLSGGEKQRVAIARAFASDPRIVLLDEPTSALDASVQGAVLDLLRELQAAREVAYILISHDFNAVRSLADDVMVMKDGDVIESGAAQTVFTAPQHEYTKTLLEATLTLEAGIASGVTTRSAQTVSKEL